MSKKKKTQNTKNKKQVYARIRGERFYTKNSKYKSPEIHKDKLFPVKKKVGLR